MPGRARIGNHADGTSLLPLRLELIPNAPDCLEVARAHRVGLDLLAQAPDVDGDGAGVAVELEVPDLVEELLAREDLAGMAGEEEEEVELAGGQVERHAVAPDIAPARIDAQRPEAEHLAIRVGEAGVGV